jgi:epoxyqueuosine reductase QueG
VGAIGKNGLLHIEPYGSRIVLQALAIEGLKPRFYDTRENACPQNCDACARACPSHAITEKGLDLGRCIRAQMEDALYCDEVKEQLSGHIGCELCMLACPLNASLKVDEPDKAIREAFDLKRLILGDAAKARALVGRNMTGKGKLIAEAIVFAAREGLYEEEIRAALNSPFEAVRDTAAWAVRKYFSKK